MSVHVVVLAYPGVDEVDLFGGYVPLVKANLPVLIAAADEEVRGANGALLRRHQSLRAVPGATVLLVPGGHGVHAAGEDPRYVAAVSEAYRRGAHLYAVCSGAFLLAAAGLTSGHVLATHASKQARLAELGRCEVVDGLVRSGRIRSIGGRRGHGLKAVELAFQILRDWCPAAVDEVSARLEYQPEVMADG